MSAAAAAAAGSSPKVAKASKPKAAKKAPSHPTYSAMIRKAVSELKDKSGSSKAAILKFMLSHYKLGDNVTKVNLLPALATRFIFSLKRDLLQINSQLRIALKKAVVKGELKQVKGSGASGSFRLGEKKSGAVAKKHAGKKPAAKKHKSSKVATKKPKAEKKAKSPKKAKAPKAKTAKKPVSKAAKPKAKKAKVSGSKTKKVKA
uniref:H15 domain-containing protein n=1 Tax=Angiostrongylus cantonensis TaxID=6313 RepID=A0A0K0CTY4_ANGCA